MELYTQLVHLPRRTKRLIFFVSDVLLAPVALIAALALRFGNVAPWSLLNDYLAILGVVTIAALSLVPLLGLYRVKLQNIEMRAIGSLAVSALALATVAVVTSYLLHVGTPRSVPLIFGTLYFVMCLGARATALAILSVLNSATGAQKRVIIYGAGPAGIQIAMALRASETLQPMFFVDDALSLQGLQIAGLKVHSPRKIERFVHRQKIDMIVLALPSIALPRREEIIRDVGRYGIEVQMLPSLGELLERGRIEEKLRPVHPDELLGRDKVSLDVPEVARAYAGRAVMVTGAGGSIGSELCRQLLDCRPRRIVLFEHSEFALYQIDQELRSFIADDSPVEIVTRLGTVMNPARISSVIRDEAVDIVLHAAAYKHVPLVEDNVLEGVRNNALGTRIVAEAALAAGIERFVLISTDKAVRPTNIMGATKRMAELIIQDLQVRSTTTKFAMVRFGNVLGSSGSVLPLFQKQIAQGGPVTVTHPDVTRFFMTIPEASRLVLLAGAFANGGDVFVLDMGEPMRIMDIARRLIELSGRRVKAGGDDGIEIRVTGLRPGEKLYEELLIDDASLTATPHAKILRAKEEYLSQIETAAMMREIVGSVDNGDAGRLREAVTKYVRGYHIPPLPPQVLAAGLRS